MSSEWLQKQLCLLCELVWFPKLRMHPLKENSRINEHTGSFVLGRATC